MCVFYFIYEETCAKPVIVIAPSFVWLSISDHFKKKNVAKQMISFDAHFLEKEQADKGKYELNVELHLKLRTLKDKRV